MPVRPTLAILLGLLAVLTSAPPLSAQAPDGALPAATPAATNQPDATFIALGTAGCTDGVVAVHVRGSIPTAYPSLPEAAAALADGDGLWVCPGVHGLDRPLQLADLTGVTVAGRDALIVASENTAVIRAERMADFHLDGLGFMHAWRWDACSADVVVVRDSTALTVTDCRFDGSGIVGLALSGVNGADVRGNFVTNCFTGIAASGSSEVALRGNRLVDNEAHCGGDLDATAVAADNDLGPTGRGSVEGSLPAPPAPAAASWLDWDATLGALSAYPIRVWNGQPYLVLEHSLGAVPDLTMPPCFDDWDGERCAEPIPYPQGAATYLPEGLGTGLQLIGPSGPCTPSLGEVVVLDTSQCEQSVTVAARLDGCGTDLAPVAFAGPALPPLTWHPRQELRFPFDEASVTDATLAGWVSRSLASSVFGSWAIPAMAERGDIASWQAEAAHERLTTYAAGFLLEYAECNVVGDSWRETWLRANDVAQAVELPGSSAWIPWRGVLALDGYVAAIVSQGATQVALVTRGADGRLGAALEQTYWSDNEECLSPELPGLFNGPCGP